MSAFSGFNWARCGVITCPALLNNRSEGELLAGIARYLRASWLRSGSTSWWFFHHCRGSSSPSMVWYWTYLSSSLRSRSRGDCADDGAAVGFRMLVSEPSVFMSFFGGGRADKSSSGIRSVTASCSSFSFTAANSVRASFSPSSSSSSKSASVDRKSV